MAYDENLAQRIRDALASEAGLDEKKMFGGLCFLVHGHMACGIVGKELMVRVGPDGYLDALKLPHAREMDFTGRPLKGMLYVGVGGIRTDSGLRGWLERAVGFARSLPPKSAKKAPKRKPPRRTQA